MVILNNKFTLKLNSILYLIDKIEISIREHELNITKTV